jgi:hypothetical protein
MTENKLHQAWECYRDAVYPDGVSGIQERELRQAFFAGVLVVTSSLTEACQHGCADLPAMIERMQDDAVRIGQQILTQINSRN